MQGPTLPPPSEIHTTPPTPSASPVKRPIGFFLLSMLMFGVITSLHGLSPLATYGVGSVFFFGFAAFGFLIPAGLVAVELGTRDRDRNGGVYLWAGEAFGARTGFVAVWLQWIQNLIFWTFLLVASAAMLALSFGGTQLSQNKAYVAGVSLGIVWLLTAVTFAGLRASGAIGTAGSIAGTIVPAAALIIAAAIYLALGNKSEAPLRADDLLPDLAEPGNITFAISGILVFAGIEVMATRIREVRNPLHTYPRSTWIAIALTILVLMPATLAIAVLVPKQELSIVTGIVQALQGFFDEYGAAWVVQVLAALIFVDAIGEIAAWMTGPSVGLSIAASDGHLPSSFEVRTGRGAAKTVLFVQAVISSVFTLLVLFQPTVRSAVWILTALISLVYLIMYAIIFTAAIRLRFARPGRPDAWRIPGGKPGLLAVCGIGLIVSSAAIVISFIPPSGMAEANVWNYTFVLAIAATVIVVAPVVVSAVLFRRRKRAGTGDLAPGPGKAAGGGIIGEGDG